MKAAVVESFDRPPSYREFDEPLPREDEVLVSVRAAALTQLVRAQSSGRHYASGKPPFVPGADGVGRLTDGQRVYFAFPRSPVGAMAERTAVKAAWTVPLPDELDDVTAAALANPAMSSWAALVERVAMGPGESVLINGATGASGRLAIQIAKHLGAGRVVATGRNPESETAMRELGADAFIAISEPRESLVERFRAEIDRGLDIVLDYVWGPSAEAFMTAATGHAEGQAAPAIRFVNIGAMGGAQISMPAAALRSSGLQMLGSGLGSLSNEALIRSIAACLRVADQASFRIDTVTRPLAEVTAAWTAPTAGRMVLKLD